ncbi:hypothetical protein [Bdellovibrio reynosensis]|uniref:Lipoprotein n=1 Tax=Bdellovibrio reynosensis TaxID=2835041 RepID=A0ABY4C9H3_9BACT|nr:hypothetical protein [Bdellovibrio reynosensis]UOF00316.1 hypothetical protein MNR06_11450 [Bdellovibrio reynosensis]
MKNHILLALSVTALLGCDRLAMDEKTKVQIQLPSITPSLSKATDVSVASTGDETRPVPTGFTGDRPINCFMIAAGGPEEALQRNVCYRKNDTTFAQRKIGMWVGGAPAGSALSFDVPSGKDRVIYVIGFYAAAGACKDFKVNSFPEHDVMSSPYLVGEVGALELKPGETKDLPIKVSFSESNRFDTCDGPDFPDDGHSDGPTGPGTSAPTQLHITKEWFPYNSFTTDSCQSFDLALKDSYGRHSTFPVAITVAPTIEINGSSQPIYNSWEECQASSSPQSSITIPAFQDRKQVVFKTPYDPTTAVISAAVTSAPNGVTVFGAGHFLIYDKNATTMDLEGPWSVLPDNCYPFDLVIKKMDNGSVYKYSDENINIGYGVNKKIYSTLATCQSNTSPITSVLMPNSTIRKTIYVKVKPMSDDQEPIQLLAEGGAYDDGYKYIHKGQGTNIAKYLEIRGNNKMGSLNYCSNMAHEVLVVNEFHTPIVLPSAMTVNLSTNNSGISYYNNTGDCGYGTGAISSVSIPAGNYKGAFFSRFTAWGTHNIIVSAAGLTSVSYPVIIDGPSMIELTPMLPGTLSNNQCVPVTLTMKNASGSVAQGMGMSVYPNVTGIPGPSLGGFYNDPSCSSYPQSYLYWPSSGPATIQVYFKVDNQSGGPLNVNVQVNSSGTTSPSIPVTVNN